MNNPVIDAQQDSSSPMIGTYLAGKPQYFLFVEGMVLNKMETFCDAMFLLFSSYYIFHLEYPKSVKNILWFMQDYLLLYPNDSMHRSALYLSVTSDIKRYISDI